MREEKGLVTLLALGQKRGLGQGIDHITFIDLFRTHEGFLPSDS